MVVAASASRSGNFVRITCRKKMAHSSNSYNSYGEAYVLGRLLGEHQRLLPNSPPHLRQAIAQVRAFPGLFYISVL